MSNNIVDADYDMIRTMEEQVRMNSNRLDTRIPGSVADDESLIDSMERQIRMDSNRLNTAVPGSAADIQDPDYIRGLEADVRLKREAEKPAYEKLDNIIKNGIPNNSEELKNILLSVDCREDYVRYLLEGEKKKMIDASYSVEHKYDLASSKRFNDCAFEYLAVINLLSELNVPHLVNKGYDPYYVDLGLNDLSTVAYIRRKNGADINIQIPKGYDYDSPQVTADLVNIINCTKMSAEHNRDVRYLWDKIGYVAKELKNEQDKTI